jgi:hypothetical protein
MPEPAAQVRHSAQTPLPADALNVPLMHVAQVRSLETVEALSMYVPAAHGALTLSHSLPSFVVENVVMPSHAPQTRSAVAEPGAV